MRVLYLSRADAFDGTSSLVNIAGGMLARMVRLDPEFYVTWVVPRGAKDDQLDQIRAGCDPKRLTFLKVNAGLSGRTLGYLFNEDLWYAVSQTKALVPYDVVLTNQLALTPIWHTLLANRYQASRWQVDVPIVNWQMWTATMRQMAEVPEYYAGEPDVIAESLSSLYAWNVWESDVLYASHLETMERYLLPETLEIVKRQSEVISNGADLSALDETLARRQSRLARRDGPVLFWGGRLANQKKPRVTFPLMEAVRQATGVKVVVTTNRPATDADVEWTAQTFPEWSLTPSVNRSTFAKMMSFGDVFLCNSASESYGLAWVEMLATGMLGVFEDHWWVRKLLPDWYPFVMANRQEQAVTAIALLRSWPDGGAWTELVPRVREWVLAEHSEERSSARLLDTLQRQRDAAVWRQSTGGSMAKLVRQAAEAAWQRWEAKPEPMPVDRVWSAMQTLSTSGREFGKQGDMVTVMYLRRMLEASGWRDVCRDATVEVVPPR